MMIHKGLYRSCVFFTICVTMPTIVRHLNLAYGSTIQNIISSKVSHCSSDLYTFDPYRFLVNNLKCIHNAKTCVSLIAKKISNSKIFAKNGKLISENRLPDRNSFRPLCQKLYLIRKKPKVTQTRTKTI